MALGESSWSWSALLLLGLLPLRRQPTTKSFIEMSDFPILSTCVWKSVRTLLTERWCGWIAPSAREASVVGDASVIGDGSGGAGAIAASGRSERANVVGDPAVSRSPSTKSDRLSKMPAVATLMFASMPIVNTEQSAGADAPSTSRSAFLEVHVEPGRVGSNHKPSENDGELKRQWWAGRGDRSSCAPPST